MVMEKEDLGLTLGLRPYAPLQLNLMPPSAVSSSFFPSSIQTLHMHKNSWSSLLSHSDGNGEARALLRRIDVNLLPSSAENEEAEVAVSSPNSTISSASGKRSEREHMHGAAEDLDTERSCSRGLSDDEDGGDGSRKKLRLSKEQAAVLEESFMEHNTLNPKQKLALAKKLNLRPRQVEVWFQNRRARTKLKQTEVDCEYLKRCCEKLTEENRRLQKEVQELRALKLSPHLYMHMTPPTTLTMCPSCERVGVSSSSASSHAEFNHPHPRPVVLPPSWAPLNR